MNPHPSRPRPPRSGALTMAWAAFVLLAAPGLAAQVVTGTVLEAETGAPLVTAVLTLLDVDGRAVARVMSNAQGMFTLRAPGPGRFVVRSERIGRVRVESDPLELGAGEIVRLELRAASQAITLAGIEVSADQQCHMTPDEGESMSRVWDQARQALQVEALSRAARTFRYRLSNHARELDPEGDRVFGERFQASRGYLTDPYLSAPIEELLTLGWVRDEPDGGGWSFFAPDAAVLLSDAFLNAHCFRLTAHDDDPGLLGLAFEPIRQSSLPGIVGALWLERSSARLDHLTFRYTHLLGSVAHDVSIPHEARGGRVEFLELADGIWVVSRWHIRMPILRSERLAFMGRVEERITLSGIREEGGQVTEIRRVGGDVVFAALPPEPALPVASEAEERALEAGRVEQFCPAPGRFPDVERGLVEGSITRRAGGEPLIDLPVSLLERRYTLPGGWEGGLIQEETWETTTQTDGRGWYRLCAEPEVGWRGLPLGHFRLIVSSTAGDRLYFSPIGPAPQKVLTHHVVLR